jgi:replicative superfamily II helicase
MCFIATVRETFLWLTSINFARQSRKHSRLSLPKSCAVSQSRRGFNDLYTSQADVLKTWFNDRNARDVIIKLHTGGGKTLVGLLMAQSTL